MLNKIESRLDGHDEDLRSRLQLELKHKGLSMRTLQFNVQTLMLREGQI